MLEKATPIDGGWSQWSPWSLPTGASNPEEVTRSRVCDSPRPYLGGKMCEGSPVDVKNITIPVDGGWSEWGEWSEPRDEDEEDELVRKRRCDNPVPRLGGEECRGEEEEYKPYAPRQFPAALCVFYLIFLFILSLFFVCFLLLFFVVVFCCCFLLFFFLCFLLVFVVVFYLPFNFYFHLST